MKLEKPAIEELLDIMAKLRSPEGCPWDREQDHRSLRFHAVEEVYELIDAIEADDDVEMVEELGDLLLQVVFHCQLAKERKAFDFEDAARHISEKLIRRHPHVFDNSNADTVEAVWTQWEKIKKVEKQGTAHERTSIFDGIPKHLPALQKAEKTIKKAAKSGMLDLAESDNKEIRSLNKEDLAKELLNLVYQSFRQGWSAEDLLREELSKMEAKWRKKEASHE